MKLESSVLEPEPEINPDEKENGLDLYNGKTFPNEEAERLFLERLQTAGKIDGIIWDESLPPNENRHWQRLLELRAKKEEAQSAGMTPEQRKRYNELTVEMNFREKKRIPLPEDLRLEFVELQKLAEKQARLDSPGFMKNGWN